MELKPEVLGAIGALVGAAGALVRDIVPWIKDRDDSAREKRRLEAAKAEVDFIAAWLAAAAGFAGEDMEQRRNEAKRRLVLLLAQPGAATPSGEPRPRKGKASRGISVAFFSYAGFFFFAMLGASIDKTADNPSLSAFVSEVTENAGLVTFLFAMLVALYVLRRRSKMRNARTTEKEA